MTEAGFRLDKTISLSILLALAIQAAAALIWAGQAAERIDGLEARMQEQSPVAERLARLETQTTAMRTQLDRMETKLDREERR